MKKSNITLIGMPGAGKSTIGIILAKNLGMGYIDTDILIQINQQKTLQEILDESDYLNLRRVEEQEILRLNITNQIIATGGSAVYSEKTMAHLKTISTIVFLDVSFDEICRRIHNFDTRGIACAENQTFEDLYQERLQLYRRYAEVTVDGNVMDQDEMAETIAELVSQSDLG
ncbi:shikimate kinase [Desulfuromonas acetoxidans]|uniref:Shikimate kinase n=1 Tax=Desulfuromonas acetoxidans (strain DSM 684 / 11070) TaxID=281689 RepID=Q1K4G3_DESA6|nr:shikimate kinase [Desulfuromonas acetoxidans]EAT17140.1 shikimate kinase [Desulfuromonas acetoxidans DSM 684]MBF0647046.1 shikimate kinase [Desulfuromonas acetoxidans]NVD24273.1 shikimate kinase [Desulfuromonas acetoxidans]NVE14954.1 shikimate kinase [Desulfuromonas acetoxidans]